MSATINTSKKDSQEEQDDNLAEDEVDWEYWGHVMGDFEEESKKEPQKLLQMIVKGIPKSLRGTVWLMLAKGKDPQLEIRYQELLEVSSKFEKAISKDIKRTFPTNTFFQDPRGVGQRALFNIMKAYSVYDSATGYCQGMSFIGGAFLLVMPEEEAFCVFVKLMSEYGMKDLFASKMEGIQVALYQLERQIQSLLPNLYQHFVEQGVNTSMFASQWFLTLFLCKFPLKLVYRMIDLMLYEGTTTLFRLSIALLRRSEPQMLQLEFEHLLAFLSNDVHVPYLKNPDRLLQDAFQVSIRPFQMDLFRKEFEEKERENDSAVVAFKRVTKKLDITEKRLDTCKTQLSEANQKAKILTKELDARTNRLSSVIQQQALFLVQLDGLRNALGSKANNSDLAASSFELVGHGRNASREEGGKHIFSRLKKMSSRRKSSLKGEEDYLQAGHNEESLRTTIKESFEHVVLLAQEQKKKNLKNERESRELRERNKALELQVAALKQAITDETTGWSVHSFMRSAFASQLEV